METIRAYMKYEKIAFDALGKLSLAKDHGKESVLRLRRSDDSPAPQLFMQNVLSKHSTNTVSSIEVPKLLIICDTHEFEFAESLSALLIHWGFDAFYCNSEIRGNGALASYNYFLSSELPRASLALIVISPSFQWSSYCQAEVGACSALKIPTILILIPHATENDASVILPLLQNQDMIRAGRQPSTAPNVDRLILDNDDRWGTKKFSGQLREKLIKKIGLQVSATNPADPYEVKLTTNMRHSLASVIEDNLISVPKREALFVWPSIDRSTDSLAPNSIIEHIKRSVSNAEIRTTSIEIVGVSLKFSIQLVTEALNELLIDFKAQSSIIKEVQHTPRKRIQISLVHMDSHADILHALRDQLDIENIIKSFHENRSSTIELWHSICDSMHIELRPTQEFSVNYIPPRIGILIDNSLLFAGTCSFSRKGDSVHLKAGENEYFFYNRSTIRGRREIAEFREYLAVYSEPSFQGVSLMSTHTQWLEELAVCVERYKPLDRVLLISQTCTKFEKLVKVALLRGIRVDVYVQHPDFCPKTDQANIRGLPDRIQKMVEHRAVPDGDGVNIFYYRHHACPAYRAALVGRDVLGVQMYISRAQTEGTVYASELKAVIPKCASRYDDLQRELIGQFINRDGVSREPDIRISTSRIGMRNPKTES